MTRLEHALSAALLRILGFFFDRLPIRRRVVLATARVAHLEGNLAAIHEEIVRRRPRSRVVTLLEPYSYGLAGKLAVPAPGHPGDVPVAHVLALRRGQRLPAGPRRRAPPADDGGAGLARRRGAEAVRRGYGGRARRAGADVPPSPLRLRGLRRGGRPRPLRGGAPHPGGAGAAARGAADGLLLRCPGPGRRPGAGARRLPTTSRGAGRAVRADVPGPGAGKARRPRRSTPLRCGRSCLPITSSH